MKYIIIIYILGLHKATVLHMNRCHRSQVAQVFPLKDKELVALAITETTMYWSQILLLAFIKQKNRENLLVC